MNKFQVLVLVLMISLATLSAASKDEVPYVNITNPNDGSTVRDIVTIKFNAVGKDLKNPTLEINGEQVGVGFPVNNCTVEIEIHTGLEHMSCSHEWNSDSFAGQKVNIVSNVDTSSGVVRDNVMVLVSGECI
ncbi:MAG: hypothetical protein ABIH20_00545 [Candidatus Diapherotrites archaeon]